MKNEERRGRADSEAICAFQTLLAAQSDNDISHLDDERASDILNYICTDIKLYKKTDSIPGESSIR